MFIATVRLRGHYNVTVYMSVYIYTNGARSCQEPELRCQHVSQNVALFLFRRESQDASDRGRAGSRRRQCVSAQLVEIVQAESLGSTKYAQHRNGHLLSVADGRFVTKMHILPRRGMHTYSTVQQLLCYVNHCAKQVP